MDDRAEDMRRRIEELELEFAATAGNLKATLGLLKMCDDSIAAMQRFAAWRPMSSAPEKGRILLAYWKDGKPVASEAERGISAWWVGGVCADDEDCLGWMPMPEPPSGPVVAEVAPRPFRVGDVVRLKDGCVPMFNAGDGHAIEYAPDSNIRMWTGPSRVFGFDVDGDVDVGGSKVDAILHPSCLELVRAAPDPGPVEEAIAAVAPHVAERVSEVVAAHNAREVRDDCECFECEQRRDRWEREAKRSSTLAPEGHGEAEA